MDQPRGTSTEGTDTAAWREGATLGAGPELTADVYLRSLSPAAGVHDGQTARIERLSALSTAGRLGDVRVSVWGDRICLCETCAETGAGRAALDRVEEFERWADEVEPTVTLPFDRRTVRSSYTDSAQEVLVPPVVLLALYDRETLLGVFPHAADGRQVSVEDALVAIETAGTPDPTAASRD
jgi:hypothetical protein